SEKRFKLRPESISYVEKLTDEVNITVCANENEFKTKSELFKQAYETIKNYQKYSSKIVVDFVDITKNPAFAKQFPNEKIDVGNVIVKCGDKSRNIASSDLFDVQESEYDGVSYSSEAEQIITAAIMFVTDKHPAQATLLGGLNNVDVKSYVDLLKRNNYAVKTQSLLNEDIDKNSTIAILPASKADLSTEQIGKLTKFLDNDGNFGKSIIYATSPSGVVGPNLKAFFAEWGMEVTNDLAYETSPQYTIFNDNYAMLNMVSDQETASKLKTDQLPLIMPDASPVKVLFEKDGARKTTIIANTSNTTIAVPFDAKKDFDISKQKKQSFSTIVKGTKTKIVSNKELNSNVLVIGSDTSLSEQFLLNASFNNTDIVMTATNGVTDRGDTVTILPVKFADQTISISDGKVKGFAIVFIAIVPLVFVAIGITVWLRRRHL
ncbi:MAG: Gldg family protein, partial [Oscillospiraceae bacterium]